MTTVATFIIIIVIGARMLYSWDPRPLTTPVVKPKFQVSSDVATEVFEQDKMSYYRQDSFTIQESFEFQDIEVMRVKTSNLRYLKAETYEIYDSGSWLRDEDLQYLDNDGDTIQNSTLFDQIDYRDFYDIENIEVTIRGINTNVLFMANYGTSDTSFDAGIRVMYDPRRGIYFADKLLEPNYSYNFNAVIPAYGNPSFDELVRQRSDLAVPSGLDVYKIMPEEGYSDLVALTESIVDGIDNKYDQALAIENYLKSNYVYSESPGSVPEGVDPVNHFLFETGEGFCQQFSSAFILMSRSVGIPTRYATGFYVDIFEPEDLEDAYMMEMDFMRDGTTSVLDSDSHTWAEAYFPEVGWIMFEATPGRLYRKDVVAGPDLNLDDLDPRGEGVGTFNLDWNYVYTLFGVIAIGVLLYMLSIFYKKRKAIKHRTPKEKMLDIHRIIRYYYGFGRTKKKINETPREYAHRVDDYMLDSYDEGMIKLMSDYEDVVYGGKEITYEDLAIHVEYMKRTKIIIRRRVNRFTYDRMRLYDFLNYIPLRNSAKA